MTTTRKTRIVVFGNSRFVANDVLQAQQLSFVANVDLFMNSINWLAEDESLIAIRPTPTDTAHRGDDRPAAEPGLPAVGHRHAGAGIYRRLQRLVEAKVSMLKYRNTLIVLVVLAALVGFLYYDQQQQAAQPTATPQPVLTLLDLNAADVIAITVSVPPSRTVAHKDNGAWLLDEPTKEEADTTQLSSVVTQFAKLTATRALTVTPTDLAPFGLVTGTLTLELKLKDNRTEVIRVGNATIGGSDDYVQHVGDPKVYLVPAATFATLQQIVSTPPKKPTPTPTSPPTTPTAGALPPLPPVATSTP